MKRRIVFFLVFSMILVLLMGMGTASADTYKTNTVTITYFDYYTGARINNFNLPSSIDLTEGQTVNTTDFVNTYYNFLSGSPAYVTFEPSVYAQTMTIYVALKTSTNTVASYLQGQNLNLSFFGDKIDPKVAIANPIPTIPAYQSVGITAENLGGIQPTNKRLTFSTSNAAIASVSGTSINGNSRGHCKFLVYYNNGLLLTKDIEVANLADLTPSPTITNNVAGLSIGPDSINTLKGKSYQIKNAKLNGVAISPAKLKWTSSDSKIATVSKSGMIKTRKAGTVVITAKTADGANSDSIKFIIK